MKVILNYLLNSIWTTFDSTDLSTTLTEASNRLKQNQRISLQITVSFDSDNFESECKTAEKYINQISKTFDLDTVIREIPKTKDNNGFMSYSALRPNGAEITDSKSLSSLLNTFKS